MASGVEAGLVFPLGSRTLASSATYRRSGPLYDYSIAGIPLLAGISEKFPYVRTTAPFRKQQFDNSANPGEQTLSTWWLRSQSSYHEGTGLKFMEPVSDPEVANAFSDSVGVNPWTPGQMTLLKQATLKKSAAADVLVMGAIDGTTDIYLHASGVTLTRETAAGSAAITWGGTGTILSLANDGANYFAADATSIWKGTLAGGAGAAAWNTGNANVVLGWAKQRLVAGIGPSVYELTGAGPALPAALYTHPSSSWKWTAVAESTSAIFVAGYNGSKSAIYKFVLSSAGVMPTLTSGVIAAVLPTGEQVLSLHSYVGDLIAIGTNKGVRIGSVDSAGNISYGPLVIESSTPVYGMVGQGRFLYVACTNQIGGSTSGLWRIDLGNQQQDGTFPYATDLNAGLSGTVNSVSIFGASGRLVFGVSNSGSWIEHATDLVASGWFQTGYVRFDTLEPKQFRYVTCRVSNQDGSVGIETVDAAGAPTSVATITGKDTSDFDMGRSTGEEYLGLRFTLNRSSLDPTKGPQMASWQIKALPAIKRSRIMQIPCLLFEEMRDAKGTAVPPTDIRAVLAQLEALEDSAAPILLAELCHHPSRTELVVIDEVRFEQISPPANCKGDGGILYLTLRTVL